jgi:hypothetical protein
MHVMQRRVPGILLVLLGASPLAAQTADWRPVSEPAGWELLRAAPVLPSVGLDPSSRTAAPGKRASGTPGFAASLVDPHVEALATLLAVQPPRISRDDLDGGSESQLRYLGLPGGIVLGLAARPIGELGATPSGALLTRDGEQQLVLALADGRVLRCPSIEPSSLRACLDFVTATRSDAVIDIAFGRPRLAPAFAGTALESHLIALDRLPHRRFPEARAWKSLIVDRDVRCEARGNELVLSADLEVRFYVTGEDLGTAQRLLTLDVPGGARAGTDSLDAELAPLAEIAAWIGFLRWAAIQNGPAVTALRRATE